MADNLEQQQILERAREAERLLANPLIKDALARLEADIVEAWVNIPVRDKEGAEELCRLIKTARKFHSIFKVYLDDGKYTAHQLAEIEREKESVLERGSRYLKRVIS